MSPSQVTYVTQASATCNHTLSPHRTFVALVLSLMYNGLVQHTAGFLQAGCEFGVVCFTRVVMVRVPLYNRVDAIEQTDFRVRAACIAGSSHAVSSSQTAPLAVFLLEPLEHCFSKPPLCTPNVPN